MESVWRGPSCEPGTRVMSALVRSLIGSLDAARDGRRHPQEILRVPGVESFSFGLERAIPEKGVVNCAAGEIRRRGLLDNLKILTLAKGDNRKILADVADKEERGVAAHPPFAGHSGEGGICLGEAVRAAAGTLLSKAQE